MFSFYNATVEAAGWLVDTRRYTEDGDKIIKEAFLVWLTLEDGTRYQHERIFSPALRLDEETGCEHIDRFEQAECKLKAEHLAARVRNALDYGRWPDLNRWTEIEPAYGSEQYQAQGIEAERAAAERQEG
jgi:hypothetical protein